MNAHEGHGRSGRGSRSVPGSAEPGARARRAGRPLGTPDTVGGLIGGVGRFRSPPRSTGKSWRYAAGSGKNEHGGEEVQEVKEQRGAPLMPPAESHNPAPLGCGAGQQAPKALCHTSRVPSAAGATGEGGASAAPRGTEETKDDNEVEDEGGHLPAASGQRKLGRHLPAASGQRKPC